MGQHPSEIWQVRLLACPCQRKMSPHKRMICPSKTFVVASSGELAYTRCLDSHLNSWACLQESMASPLLWVLLVMASATPRTLATAAAAGVSDMCYQINHSLPVFGVNWYQYGSSDSVSICNAAKPNMQTSCPVSTANPVYVCISLSLCVSVCVWGEGGGKGSGSMRVGKQASREAAGRAGWWAGRQAGGQACGQAGHMTLPQIRSHVPACMCRVYLILASR